jgi:Zn-dependent protease
MAYLLSTGATGNWTTASTWSAAHATNFIDSRAASTAVTQTPVANTSFSFASAPPTLQGIAVQLSSRAATPAGTLTAELYNVTGATSVRSVTVNVSDISTTYGAAGSTWVYFKFASNVTLATGTNYAIRLSTSSAGQITCYALATTNWSYLLITTTNQASVASDSVIVTGTHTGAGAFTPSVVTMDNTALVGLANIFVSNRGTLTCGTAESTNYQFGNYNYSAGLFFIGYGGSVYLGGYSGGLIPSTSTVTLHIGAGSAASLQIFGTFVTGSTYANASGTGTGKPINKLGADVASGATGTTVTDSTTGWKSGDQIVVPSTTRTATQYEVITLDSDQSGTTITHSATPYVNAHGGNASTLVQADLANLTRNIIIKSINNLTKGNIQVQTNSIVNLYGVRLQDMGSGIAVTTAGIGVSGLTQANGASFTMRYCVLTNTNINSATLSGTGLFTASDIGTSISNNVFYGLGWTALTNPNSIYGINDYNMFIGNYGTYCSISTYCGSNNVFSSNTCAGAGYSGGFYQNATRNSFYSNSAYGLYFIGNTLSTGMSYFYIWRNNAQGIGINSNATTNPRTLIWDFSNCYIFGNTTSGIIPIASLYTKVSFNNCYIYGGSTLVQIYGMNPNTQYLDTIYFYNCSFGYDNNNSASPHTISNIFNPTRQSCLLFYSCLFNGTEISGQTPSGGYNSNSLAQSFVSVNHNQSGLNKQWLLNGTISGDNVIYNSASPSIRMTPLSATYKLSSPTFKIPIRSNGIYGNAAIYIAARKSSANLMTYTEDVTNAVWLTDAPAVTKTANATNSPTGTPTADKISESSTALGAWNTYQSIAAAVVIPGTVYVFTVYLKAAERQYARVTLGTASVVNGGDLYVDLSAGTTVTANQYGTATLQVNDIVNAGNGWWRCVLGVSFAASAIIYPSVQIRLDNSGSTATYNGVVGRGIYVWGAMLYTTDIYNMYGNYPTYEPVLTTPTNTPYNGLPPRVMQVSGVDQVNVYLGALAFNYSSSNLLTSVWANNYSSANAGSYDYVAEIYIDCDGTQGWINIDDITANTGAAGSIAADTRGTDFMALNGNYIEADWRKPGGSNGFVS